MGKLRQSTEQIQDILDNVVTSKNLKTVNGQSLLGEGNIEIQGGGEGAFIPLSQDFSNDFYEDFAI